jgi:hypothetical protein
MVLWLNWLYKSAFLVKHLQNSSRLMLKTFFKIRRINFTKNFIKYLSKFRSIFRRGGEGGGFNDQLKSLRRKKKIPQKFLPRQFDL